MDIHYALHNIVLPLTNVLVPIICQHKRITSIHCIYAIMHISILFALSKGLLIQHLFDLNISREV
jgi:hypothetical protein